ncbi:hypothetical protein B0A52_05716 [Exophiala mesophila]|uniref:Uncharacterized protein n=1 Tax=Exophiala mesophila TaxID=212818 RepID=A0A438N2C2_EXOME|nr:hypothetical protein B0A52_05716 [Exophiala mesophila]
MISVHPLTDSSSSVYRFESPSRVGSPAHGQMGVDHARRGASSASGKKQQAQLPQLVHNQGAYPQIYLPYDPSQRLRQMSRESSNIRAQPSSLSLTPPKGLEMADMMYGSNRQPPSSRRPNHDIADHTKPVKAQVFANGHQMHDHFAHSHGNRSTALNPATSDKPSNNGIEVSQPLKLSNRLSRPFNSGPFKFLDSLPGKSEHPQTLRPGIKVVPQVSAATEYVPLKGSGGALMSEAAKVAKVTGTSEVQQILTQMGPVCGPASVAARNRRAIARKPVANLVPVTELEVRENIRAPVRPDSSTEESACVTEQSASVIPTTSRPGSPQHHSTFDASIQTAKTAGNSPAPKMHHEELHLVDRVRASESIERLIAPVPKGLLAVPTLPVQGRRPVRKSEKGPNSATRTTAINLALYGPAAIAPATVFSQEVVPRNVSPKGQAISAIHRGTPVKSSIGTREQMYSVPDVLRIGKRVANRASSGKTQTTNVSHSQGGRSPLGHHSDRSALDGQVGVLETNPGLDCKPSRINSFRFTKDWGTKLDGLVQDVKQEHNNGSSAAGAIPTIIVTYHELPSDSGGLVVKVFKPHAAPAELEATLSSETQAKPSKAVEIRSFVRPLAPGQTSRAPNVSPMAANSFGVDVGGKRPTFHWLRFGRRNTVQDPAEEHCRQYRARRDAARRVKREGMEMNGTDGHILTVVNGGQQGCQGKISV